VKLSRKFGIFAVAGSLVWGLFALPGVAAPVKMFSLNFQPSVSSGLQTIRVTIKNEAPNGNSNINSFTITGTGVTIKSISPGTGAVSTSGSGSTISVTGITTLKPQQIQTYTLMVDVSGCAITWSGTAFTGNSLTGDSFALQTQLSSLTTSVTGNCGTINVTKYNDLNVNGQRDTGENVLTNGWQFKVTGGSLPASGVTQTTGSDGTTNFFLPAGDYTLCETDSKIDPTSSGWSSNPWSSTVPDNCVDLNVTVGNTTPVSFGNAIGNLNCSGQLTTTDGVVVTRLNNTDNSTCYLKPATLTSTFGSDGDNVTFLVGGTQKASYEFHIPWGPTDKPVSPPTDPVQIPDSPTTVDLRIVNGGLVTDVHNMKWCLPDGGDLNLKPDLPPGEVACLESETWTISSVVTQLLKTDTIYAEADLVLSCKTCR
jgi:hypothetical protein